MKRTKSGCSSSFSSSEPIQFSHSSHRERIPNTISSEDTIESERASSPIFKMDLENQTIRMKIIMDFEGMEEENEENEDMGGNCSRAKRRAAQSNVVVRVGSMQPPSRSTSASAATLAAALDGHHSNLGHMAALAADGPPPPPPHLSASASQEEALRNGFENHNSNISGSCGEPIGVEAQQHGFPHTSSVPTESYSELQQLQYSHSGLASSFDVPEDHASSTAASLQHIRASSPPELRRCQSSEQALSIPLPSSFEQTNPLVNGDRDASHARQLKRRKLREYLDEIRDAVHCLVEVIRGGVHQHQHQHQHGTSSRSEGSGSSARAAAAAESESEFSFSALEDEIYALACNCGLWPEIIRASCIYARRVLSDPRLLPSQRKKSKAYSFGLTAMLVASKIWQDIPYTNEYWSRVAAGSFSVDDINAMERSLLKMLDFSLAIPESEYDDVFAF